MKKIVLVLLVMMFTVPAYADGRHERAHRRETPQENAYRQMDGFYRDFYRFNYEYRFRRHHYYYPGLYLSIPIVPPYYGEDHYDDYYDDEGE